MIDTDELLTVEQVAVILKLGRTKVYALLDRGDLLSVRIDRSRRVRRSDLKAYITRLPAEEVAHA